MSKPNANSLPEAAPVQKFEFSEGAVLTCFDSGSQEGIAFYFENSALTPSPADSPALAQLDHFASRSQQGIYKLIGTRSALALLQPILRARGITLAKTHELELGQNEVYFYTREGRARVSKSEGIRQAPRPVKVLIVDDSKTIRDLLTKILAADPLVQVVAVADGPGKVEELIAQHKPDVITLDIHMPEMDGVTLLKKYLPRFPIPTIMISSISLQEGPLVLSALESGAVDYIQKPSFDQLKVVAPLIIEKIKIAAGAKVNRRAAPTLRAKAKPAPTPHLSTPTDFKQVIAIGSSTGGTEALRELMAGLPDQIPPIVVVQHIPPVFSKAFAMRMNELFAFDVKEAEDGDILRPNLVLIAPGGRQMSLKPSPQGKFRVVIEDSAPVNRHKPSVDVLFDSVHSHLGNRVLGVILTGMGADGAKGLLKLRQAGCRTIAQDEASCVVFGMPREAIKINAAEFIVPLDQIATRLTQLLSDS
jgi:two-component system chemotaxis response regulator CheB